MRTRRVIALAQLAESRIRQPRVQLGLPREHDLQDLLAPGLQVRQQPQLLENRRIEVLRLVDQQRHVAALAGVIEQELVQPVQAHELAAVGGETELAEDVGEDLVEGDRRVEQQDGAHLGVERVEHATEQRRLPGARLTDQGDESLAAVDAVGEGGHRLLVAVVQIEEARVGRDVERQLLEAEMGLVHRPSMVARHPPGMPGGFVARGGVPHGIGHLDRPARQRNRSNSGLRTSATAAATSPGVQWTPRTTAAATPPSFVITRPAAPATWSASPITV